jgi:hypothetical protein
MKSIKKAMQYGALAIVAGVITYQASANLLNIGGEDDKSGVSVLSRRNDDNGGSLVRVGGLSVGGDQGVVGYERKTDRACDKGRYDARHNRNKSYFRGKNQDEYDSCKADEQSKMNAEGKQPKKRGRTTNSGESRRTKRMKTDNQ